MRAAMTQPVACAPVLFLVFNRPEQTARVFEAIRQARPSRLYVAADGPRPDRPRDAQACAQTRAIATEIDWPCQLHTLMRDFNLGCAQAVSQAITWFFEQEEEGIVIEDDCLPDASFFPYCSRLLHRYRHDQRVGQVCGFNLLPEESATYDYFASHFGWSWGWGAWRRSWSAYDRMMASWPELKSGNFHRQHPFYPERCRIFDAAYQRLWRETWDYQWHYALASQGQLSLVPSVSLVQNIGFTADATHTFSADPRRARPASSLPAEDDLRHPGFLLANPMYEANLIRAAHAGARRELILGKIKRLLRRLKP